MEIGILIIVFWYVLNILWLVYGFAKVKSFVTKTTSPLHRFSIIVPFRNEAENLPQLLNSLSNLNYPKDLFEVILVNDASEDQFQIPNLPLQILVLDTIRTTPSPKKDAINTAIQKANHNWIITTDADCEVGEDWLKSFDSFIQNYEPKMIASGVYFKASNSILDSFQQLDLLSLQGTTIGSFGNQQAFMCNGANFCYHKSFFEALNGFDGNDTIASGDDVFLLQKAIAKDAKDVHFLKSEATQIQTQPETSWRGLFYQRVRWASKTANYSGNYSKQLGLSVFMMNLFWILSLILVCLGLIEYPYFLLMVVAKLSVDALLLVKTNCFFKTQIRHFALSNLIYPFFSTTVVIYSFFGNYSWKGRTFKK
ncbi:glycosyltransferase family 2 protein [Flavobacterium sp. GCM10027622]|uniref:glycosyltransferase family 2 protein n=1 Tax=unclassified Flavobacterium TaxID=196869 RepID=UPI003616AEA1